MKGKKLSRRDFLRLSTMTAAGAALAACAPSAPEVVEETVEVPIEETVEVDKTEVVEATAPAEAQDVKITMWFQDFLYVQFFTDRGNEWAEMHPEYNIEFDIVQMPDAPETADTFIGNLVAGTGAPDIIGIERGWFPRLLKGGLAEQGMYDLNPWIELEGPGFKDKFLRWELYSWAGKTYGVESGLCASVYYYRKDIFDDAGLDPSAIETYDDFIQVGKALREATGSYMTVADTVDVSYPLLFMIQNDGGAFDENGDVAIDSPQSIEALQLYTDMANLHEVAFPTSEFWGGGLQAAFQDGTVAGIIAPDWYSDNVLKVNVEDQAGKWAITPMPIFKSGGRRTTVWGGTGVGVTQQSEYADIAWEILKYTYMTKENQVKRYLDIHYFPTMLDALDDPRILAEEDEFFGGQAVGAVFAEVAPDVPFNYTHPYKAEALDLLSNEVVSPVMAGERDPEDALKDAAQSIREMIAEGA